MVTALALSLLLSAGEEPTDAEVAVAKIEESPKAMRVVWSAAVCVWTLARSEAKQEIATERRYAREGGGVVDMAVIHRMQRQMRQADEHIARAREELSPAKPLRCSDKAVAVLSACAIAQAKGGDEEGACVGPYISPLLEVLYRADPPLRPL